jgi:Glycosyltransferase family 17
MHVISSGHWKAIYCGKNWLMPNRIWDLIMFNHELDMLEGRLMELDDLVYQHVIVEMPVTHRNYPKPLYLQENMDRFKRWHHKITYVISDPPPDLEPWPLEHWQRHQAWAAIENQMEDSDLVWLCDLDEIPSPMAARWPGSAAAGLEMRVFLFAVDWEYTGGPIPQSVMARGSYIRRRIHEGKWLGDIRDERPQLGMVPQAGWHFSWMGGVENHRKKLNTATCHTEIFNKPEAQLILDGYRYKHGNLDAGGGLEAKAVDVDETWPRFIYERKCPDNWFRPREGDV